MAEATIVDPAVVTVGAVDLQSMVTAVTLTANQMSQTFQAAGRDGPCIVPSRRSSGDTVALTIMTDHDEAATAMLWNLLGTKALVTVKNEEGDASATNPEWTANCFISVNTPLGGDVGNVSPNALMWNVDGRIMRDDAS